MTRKTTGMGRVLVMVAALLLSCSAMAQPNDKVVLQLKWEHEFQFAGYYAALWQGFYAQEGLDVELRSAVTPEGEFLSADEQVRTGAADFGIGGIDAMVARGRGEDFVVLSTVFQRSPVAVFSLESQPMDTLLQLSQLRLAAVTDDFTRTQVLALFMEAGVDPNSVRFVDVPTSVDSLVDGSVDAVVTYDVSAQYRARELGVRLNMLHPADHGVNFYGDALYTTERLLTEDPEMVERFVRASLRGWEYAVDNRDEIAVRIAAELPRYKYLYEDFLGYNRYFAQSIDDYLLTQVVPLGHNQLERWEHAYFLLQQLGLITIPFTVDELVHQARPQVNAVMPVTTWLVIGIAVLALAVSMLFIRSFHWRLFVAAPVFFLVLQQLGELRLRTVLVELERVQVFENLSSVRYQLESALSNNLSLINGLAAFIASNPDFSQQEFDTYAATVLMREPALRNLAAAPGLVVSYVYPREGNEEVIGLDYNTNEAQRPAVLRVIRTGSMVIAGPLELVQGGTAFVARSPVYLDDETGTRRLWGIVSAPISVASIYADTDLFDPGTGLEIAIRGRDGLGAEGEVFFGSAEVFNNPRTVTMPVVVGGGSWQIGAYAFQDINQGNTGILLVRVVCLLMALMSMLAVSLRQRALGKEHAYEQRIFRNEQFLREVETVSRVGGWRLTSDGQFSEVSAHFCQIMGVVDAPEPLSLERLCAHFNEESSRLLKRLVERALQRSLNFDTELRLLRLDNSELWLHIRGEILQQASGQKELVGAIQDITKAKKADSLIEYQANYDALTGLANRTLFRDRLNHALAMARRTSTKLAVVFIDLDNFKSVNDNLGHDVGDEVLVEAAKRIRSCVREVDTVARYSGDEFIVVIRDVFTESSVWRIVDNIVATVALPYVLRTHQVYCGASVGISFFPDDAKDGDTLIIKADQAMYEVKKSGRNGWLFYTDEMQKKSERRHDLYTQLVEALKQKVLTVHYQPIYSLKEDRIVGCEALARWPQADGSFVPPDVFIPLAEESGLVIAIDLLVLQAARDFVSGLNDAFGESLHLSVNVSTRLLYMRDESAQEWFRLIKSPGNVPVTVEITERVLVEDAARALQLLNELSSAGVSISIDDFGTGYSGLNYLSRFPVHGLKIDRSFVEKIGQAKTEEALIETILLMATKLQLAVVAEGVETQEQLDFLRAANCDLVQGYFLGRPVPAAQLREILQAQAARKR